MSDQLISKRKSEMFRRMKASTIIKLIKVFQAKQTEIIYNLSEADPNLNLPEKPKDDNKSFGSQQTTKSNIANITTVTYATEMLGI